MPPKSIKTKPSLLESGLPCASLSSECQSDNDARQRPPQNRLHVWWARRPPTICRVANLTALLPFDADLKTAATTAFDPPVSEADLEDLSAREREHLDFYRGLLTEYPPTPLTEQHRQLLLALRVFGDPVRFDNHRAAAREAGLPLLRVFSQYLSGNRDPSVPAGLISHLREVWRRYFDLAPGEVPVLLDCMAGGGAIPLEGVRYGLRVFANELNAVAALILKATIEYPARFSDELTPHIEEEAQAIAARLRARLAPYFPLPSVEEWWPQVERAARTKFAAKAVERIEPDETHEPRKNTYLWASVFPCRGCDLRVPLSTKFVIDSKGPSHAHLAVFPVVPKRDSSNECNFRIVARPQWGECVWPRPGFEAWHPEATPTFQGGKVICPRCGRIEQGEDVKQFARAQSHGLEAQLYAVASQVPVRLSYKGGEIKIRYLWWFRTPNAVDLFGLEAATGEAQRLHKRWQDSDLLAREAIPDGDKTREPLNMGFRVWSDLFRPRQLLTNITVLDEILAAGQRLRNRLPEAQAEAVSVYLALMLSKLVNYNSASASWHDGRRQMRGTMMAHDLRFHAGFTEFEGAREPIPWAVSQVVGAYRELAAAIHGAQISSA